MCAEYDAWKKLSYWDIWQMILAMTPKYMKYILEDANLCTAELSP